MELEEEEDLILEVSRTAYGRNSPLYQYLNEDQGTCNNDILSDVWKSTVAQDTVDSPTKSQHDQQSDKFQNLLQSITVVPPLRLFHTPCDSANAVLESGLLEDDDYGMVYEETVLSQTEKDNDSNYYSYWLLLCCVIPVVISIFMNLPYDQVILCVLFLVFTPKLLSYAVYAILYKTSMEYVIVSMQSMDKSITDCIKLIREREVLARGYTTLSSKTLTSKFTLACPKTNAACCLKLREVLWAVMRQSITDMQKLCLNIRNGCTTVIPVNVSTICMSELEALINTNPDDQATSHQEDGQILQLTALKALHQFLCLQRSEYLRIVCTVVPNSKQHNDRSTFVKSIQSHTEKLKTAYALYTPERTLLDSRQVSTPGPESTAHNKNVSEPETIAARSLSLHLQRALEISLTIPSTLPSQFDLEIVETSIKCSLACLYEIRDTLYPIVNRQSHAENENSDGHISDASLVDSCARKGLETVPELVVGDQVFEGVIDSDRDSKHVEETSEDSIMSSIYGKQNLGTVLGELKSVLKGRSEVMRHREAVALAAFKGVDLKNIEEQFLREDEERERIEARNIHEEQNNLEENKTNIFEEKFQSRGAQAHMDLKSELMAMFQNNSTHFASRQQEYVTADSDSEPDSN